MDIEKKALYNLLRMNWLNDPTTAAEPWQVEDYRSLSLKDIFRNLDLCGVSLNQQSFLNYVDEVDSPEELAEALLEEIEIDSEQEDQVYLLIFELWRRLIPERMSLSIFCDELDHRIYHYDKRESEGDEPIQDAIANLQMIMDENVDQGEDPVEIFHTVSMGSANDIENFLYDYIAEQIDDDNLVYASELVDGFSTYLKGSKWFDLLKIRLQEATGLEAATENLRKIVLKAVKDDDLSFNLEVLAFIVQGGEKSEFNKMVRKTIPLLSTEEDFQDLLYICSDYYRCIDEDNKEEEIQAILENRKDKPLEDSLANDDEDLSSLLKLLR